MTNLTTVHHDTEERHAGVATQAQRAIANLGIICRLAWSGKLWFKKACVETESACVAVCVASIKIEQQLPTSPAAKVHKRAHGLHVLYAERKASDMDQEPGKHKHYFTVSNCNINNTRIGTAQHRSTYCIVVNSPMLMLLRTGVDIRSVAD